MFSLIRLARSATRLHLRDRRAAWRALGWLVLAHGLLATCSYPTACRVLRRAAGRRRGCRAMTAAECARAIERAHTVYPFGRCLARALAGDCLLRCAGRAPRVVLGVGFDAGREFEAHAWLECDGAIVLGAEGATRYTPLLS